jgi:hypothetical protein
MMFDLTPSAIAIAIPVMFLLAGVAITITSIIVEGGKKELLHKERMLAMEKALELPKLEEKKKRPRYLAMRAWGFVFLFPGFGLMIGLHVVNGIEGSVWALMPMGLGAGLLLASYLEKKEAIK